MQEKILKILTLERVIDSNSNFKINAEYGDLIELAKKIETAINYTQCCTELQAIEELKDFAYNNCQLHNTDQLNEIMERL